MRTCPDSVVRYFSLTIHDAVTIMPVSARIPDAHTDRNAWDLLKEGLQRLGIPQYVALAIGSAAEKNDTSAFYRRN